MCKEFWVAREINKALCMQHIGNTRDLWIDYKIFVDQKEVGVSSKWYCKVKKGSRDLHLLYLRDERVSAFNPFVVKWILVSLHKMLFLCFTDIWLLNDEIRQQSTGYYRYISKHHLHDWFLSLNIKNFSLIKLLHNCRVPSPTTKTRERKK